MRLINCHIENFGKISDQTFDFSKDCTQICQENGWGKSTLATFIRVMFYGFAGEGKRSDVENERKHYKPWQGGVYGGMLTFETNEKQYQIFRTFGTKEKDDVFVLRDAKTNLESSDFSKKIGEELFQIDLESFCRTVFISQNDCQTSTNGSINAKLGNLAENTDDINNFEKVDNKLKSLLNSMSPTRKQGSLYKMKDEISRIEMGIRQGALLDQSMDDVNRKMYLLKQEKENLQDRLQKLQQKQKTVSLYKDTQVKREKYETACRQVQEREEALQNAKAYFPGKIPEDGELNMWMNHCAKMDIYKENAHNSSLNEKETSDYMRLGKIFADQIPTEDDLNRCKDQAKVMTELELALAQNKLTADEEEKLQIYQSTIGMPIPKDHEILHHVSQWTIRNECKNNLSSIEREAAIIKNKAEEQKSQENTKSSMLLVGILLALGGAGCLLFQTILGCMLIGAGVFLAIVGMSQQLSHKKEYEQKQKEYQNQLKELEKNIGLQKGKIASVESHVQSFLNQYQMLYEEDIVVAQLYELKNQCQEYRSLLAKKETLSSGAMYREYSNLKKSVESYLLAFYPAEVVEKNSHMEAIYALQKHKELYLSLRMKQEQYELMQKRYQEYLKALRTYIVGLDMDVSDSIRSQLLEIKEHLQQYYMALEEYENVVQVKIQLENSVGNVQELSVTQLDGDSSEDTNVEMSLESLAGEMANCNDRLQQIQESMSQYLRQINDYQEKRAQIAEDEEQVGFLKEQYQEDLKKFKRIEKTKELLTSAKESFTAKYMEPITSGFKKYYHLLTGKEADQYQIDANTQLTVMEQGLQRNPNLFSTGYQDLMGICMRMALVDAMYSQEKPFLVFDDPFVNLDEEKTRGGMEFLKEISKEYQVIYFTCHESRCEK